MAVTGYELYEVTSEFVTVDFLVWKRYRQRARGIVEIMLDTNPQLSWVHRTTPFIPVGVYVRIPIDPDLIMGKPPVLPTSALWTDEKGMTI
jgi:phage tail protein X